MDPGPVEMGMDPPPQPTLRAAGDRRRYREYLLALDEERCKIQVFQRELPLCLDLVTQTIEGMWSRMMDSVGSSEAEETDSDLGPVLEEFMPLKPSLSPSSSDEHDTARDADGVAGKKGEEAADTPPQPETKKAMPDWLRSVLLWSQQRTSPPHKELPCKPVALEGRKARGAFHPFEKEKRVVLELPASSTTAAVEDGGDDKAAPVDTDKRDDSDMETGKDAKGGNKEGRSSSSNRKPRRCWAPELHRRFLQALQQLGGSHVATPKQIRELMKVDDLTNDEKYRLHTRRPNSAVHSSRSASAAPQFVVVGGIWVPPPEYAAAAAAQSPVQLAADVSIYAPVATLPSGRQPQSQQLVQRQQRSRCSDGRRSGSAGYASPASPAVSSSSSQTTSA